MKYFYLIFILVLACSAESKSSQSLSVSPEQTQALEKAREAYSQGHYPEAVIFYEKVSLINSFMEDQDIFNFANSLFMVNKFDESRHWYSKYISKDAPLAHYAYYNLACILSLKKENYWLAAYYLKKAYEIGFTDLDHYIQDSDLENFFKEYIPRDEFVQFFSDDPLNYPESLALVSNTVPFERWRVFFGFYDDPKEYLQITTGVRSLDTADPFESPSFTKGYTLLFQKKEGQYLLIDRNNQPSHQPWYNVELSDFSGDGKKELAFEVLEHYGPSGSVSSTNILFPLDTGFQQEKIFGHFTRMVIDGQKLFFGYNTFGESQIPFHTLIVYGFSREQGFSEVKEEKILPIVYARTQKFKAYTFFFAITRVRKLV